MKKVEQQGNNAGEEPKFLGVIKKAHKCFFATSVFHFTAADYFHFIYCFSLSLVISCFSFTFIHLGEKGSRKPFWDSLVSHDCCSLLLSESCFHFLYCVLTFTFLPSRRSFKSSQKPPYATAQFYFSAAVELTVVQIQIVAFIQLYLILKEARPHIVNLEVYTQYAQCKWLSSDMVIVVGNNRMDIMDQRAQVGCRQHP